LRRLAAELEIPERTLRRAASEGLLHGERTSPRSFALTLREENYLRGHWPLLRTLRAALRTEPNVRLAVLFGSAATGRARERSDVDLLVALEDAHLGRLAELSGRVSDHVGRDVQLVRLSDAEGAPALMLDVINDGRVLIDRDRQWPQIRSSLPRWRQRARRLETHKSEPLDG